MIDLTPIGTFHCREIYPYDVPRQGILAGDNRGEIILNSNCGFEHATCELASFSRIWIIYLFHHNNSWKPMVLPPRHRRQKVGVFACRSPYRPNPIGLSCVKLVAVNGLSIEVAGHDLLDNTPILDIKPYLPYADSFPDASPGWTSQGSELQCSIVFTEKADTQTQWLETNGVPCLRQFIRDRLSCDPLNAKRNRLTQDWEDCHVLAYRTWRILFKLQNSTVTIVQVRSGYTDEEMADPLDKYQDKHIHKQFRTMH